MAPAMPSLMEPPMRLFLKSLVVLGLLTGAAHAESVDLELVFAADGSGSIDTDELRLQRQGWADALTSRDVLDGVKDGPLGAIAVAFMEWGGPSSQVLIVDWHVIRDEASARIFADKLTSAPRGATGYNSISNAIDFSVRLAESNAHEGSRRVIDVSGDGPNMNGRSLEQVRAEALAKGFTINALAIRRPGSGRPGGPGGMSLEDYYGQSVIGGPGSFVEIADATQPFAVAARRKLLNEVAGRVPATRYAGWDQRP